MVLFLLGFQFFVNAQQVSDLQNGAQGLWVKNSAENISSRKWEAQWIWLPKSAPSDVMLARRSFSLDKPSTNAKLRISASSKYELYVNETYICQGPTRSAPHHQSYDILDISSLLTEGKNTIAIRVHYQKGTTSYHLEGRAGLLVQLDFENQNSVATICSDNSWKVHPDLSWDNNAPIINRFQTVVNDRIDLNKKMTGFETKDFDDSNWYAAKPLLRNSGWPAQKPTEKASTLTTPWTSLVLRDVPYLKETDIKADHLIEAKQIASAIKEKAATPLTGTIQKEISKTFKSYVKNKSPLNIPPTKENETWFLLFDFGKVINGMPKLTIEGEKNTEIQILSAPFMVDQEFTYKIVASTFKDELLLSGKKDTWQSMYFKPTRYLAIKVKGNKDAIKIHYAGIHQLEYPFELQGSINTPEAPWIEQLWKASIKTIDACTTDAFTDNYRERRQYAQTGYYAALGNYFTYGDSALQRKYLVQVAQEQQANGLMPAYAPLTKDDYMVILDSNCLWIRSLYNYLLYSGDYITVKELLPSAQKLMSLLSSFTNELGMLDSPPYSYWLDHTLNDRRGANLTFNGHYLGALNDYATILKWFNRTKESDIHKQKAELLRTSIRENFWNAEKKLFADAYIDGKQSTQFSEHANAMALACKIASPEQAELIAKQLLAHDKHNYIKRENGITMVSPAMSYFLHKGLAEYGYEEASLEMMHQRFNKMLDPKTNGTLWEEWWRNGTGRTGKFQERTRSDAQTESVFPPALFTTYVLGIKVTKPGMKELIITKPKTSLTTIEGSIPTPNGLLSIRWKLSSKKKLSLMVPAKTTVKVNTFDLGENILLNGKITDSKDNFIHLTAGEHTITF